MICPDCDGTGERSFLGAKYPCQKCYGKGELDEMVHYIVFSEGYRPHLDRQKRLMENKKYLCKMPDGKMAQVTPAFREMKMYDVVVPKQIGREVMLDLGIGTTQGKRFKSLLLRAWSLILRAFKPLGFTYESLEPSTHNAIESRKVKNFLVAKRYDKYKEVNGTEYELL